MTHDEAIEVLEALFPGVLPDTGPTDWAPFEQKLRDMSGDERRRGALALATVWRHDQERTGFMQPGADLIELVQETIGEPVFGAMSTPIGRQD